MKKMMAICLLYICIHSHRTICDKKKEIGGKAWIGGTF